MLALNGRLRSGKTVTFVIAVAMVMFAQIALPAGVQTAAAQNPGQLEEPVQVTLETKDGVTLVAWYYQGSAGKESAPIILLHEFKGSVADFADFALFLQQQGYCVLLPDLRGHGESTAVKGLSMPLKAESLKLEQFNRMIREDMEALKRFLIAKNNEGKCNIERLCVIGAELGAVVGFNWTVYDWKAPPLVTGKQGQDVAAVVLMSPRWNFKGLRLDEAIKEYNVPQIGPNIPALIVVGKTHAASYRDAKRLKQSFEKSHPEPDPNDEDAKPSLFMYAVDANLEGTGLFESGDQEMLTYINAFIKVSCVDKNVSWKERTQAFKE